MFSWTRDKLIADLSNDFAPTAKRVDAARRLSGTKDPKAIGALVAALDSPSTVRVTAARSLREVGWQAASHQQQALFLLANAEWDSLARMGTDACSALIAVLEQPWCWNANDKEATSPLLLALGKVEDPRSVEMLLRYYLNPQFTDVALRAIVQRGHKAAADIVRCLHIVPVAAASVLQHFDDKTSAEALIALLLSGPDTDHQLAQAAARSLGARKDRSALPALAKLLYCSACDRAAETAIVSIDDPIVFRYLDLSERMRLGTALSLAKTIGTKVIPTLLEMARGEGDSTVRQSILRILTSSLSGLGWVPRTAEELAIVAVTSGKSPSSAEILPAARPTLLTFWQIGDVDTRVAAMSSLQYIDRESYMMLLLEAIRDPTARIRSAAAYRLRDFPSPAVEAALINALADVNGDVRMWAVDSMSAIPESSTGLRSERLLPLVHDSDVNVRKSVAKSLAQLSDPMAIECLQQLAIDSHQDVRFVAAYGLARNGVDEQIGEVIDFLGPVKLLVPGFWGLPVKWSAGVECRYPREE